MGIFLCLSIEPIFKGQMLPLALRGPHSYENVGKLCDFSIRIENQLLKGHPDQWKPMRAEPLSPMPVQASEAYFVQPFLVSDSP
jgi:hypothetical protein